MDKTKSTEEQWKERKGERGRGRGEGPMERELTPTRAADHPLHIYK